MRKNTIEDFWNYVEKGSGCWLWRGALEAHGYGVFRFEGKHWKSHRLSYVIAKGEIKEESLDHLCRVRSCVNPDHLEPVTKVENTLRGMGPTAINKRKTHCHKGHPFIKSNLRKRSDGNRRCAKCHMEYQKNWMRLHRSKHKVKSSPQ